MAYPKKSEPKKLIVSVFELFTNLVSSLSQADLEALASGKARLTVTQSSSNQIDIPFDRTLDTEKKFDRLRIELSSAETTESGFSILKEERLTRVELERLARSLDLLVIKRDSAERLEEKIIEALVGSRLNSRAVRGR